MFQFYNPWKRQENRVSSGYRMRTLAKNGLKETQFHTNVPHIFNLSEVTTRRCSVKKVFLKILQNSQENTFARISF